MPGFVKTHFIYNGCFQKKNIYCSEYEHLIGDESQLEDRLRSQVDV